MRINPISFTGDTADKTAPQKESKFNTKINLENFYTKARNSADMTDAILVPRTIFKGYLGIMAGTTLLTLGSLISKHKKTSKALSILGALTSLYGTYSFVRPYIIKDTKGVQTVQDIKNQQA